MNFDQVKYFSTHILLGNPTDTYAGSAPASLPWPVVTIQSPVIFVFLAAIFYIIIHFQLNFMFLVIICPNTVSMEKSKPRQTLDPCSVSIFQISRLFASYISRIALC